MGGSGSTRWLLHSKKQTVEESLKLDAGTIIGKARRLTPHMIQARERYGGSITWSYSSNGKQYAQIGFQLVYSPFRALYLMYTANGQPIALSLRLDAISCYFGGYRYLFRCPSCGTQCRCVYLPPGARRFACRKCHDLSYEARQDTSTAYIRRHFPQLALLANAERVERRFKACRRWRKKKERLWDQYVGIMRQLERKSSSGEF